MRNIEIFTVYKFNHNVIHNNLEGITHEESLVSPDGGGNSINWILGHILVNRNSVNSILGLPDAADENIVKHYSRGTQNITRENAVRLEDMLRMFDDTQKKLEAKIPEIDLSTDEKKAERLALLAFHEAYHSGQTGLLRRVVGKEGAIK